MSTKEREPLLGDKEIRGSCSDDPDMDPIYVRNIYETARAKDAELIQQLVDAINYAGDCGTWLPEMQDALNEAKAAGFTPSEP